MPLRLLADDLTGALDSAAAFASPEAPVEIMLALPRRRQDGSVAASSESRHLAPDAARDAIRRFWHGLEAGGQGLWFKKVDSVLRGSPLVETAALMAVGSFARCVFAPAFPAMGRVTRDGFHWVADSPGNYRPAPLHDLRQEFAALGLRACGEAEDDVSTADVVLIDALDESDLLAAVGRWRNADQTLWAGSRGLAGALAGKTCPPFPVPPVAAVIIGTTHAVTRAQVAAMQKSGAAPLLLDPARDSGSPGETLAALAEGIETLPALPAGAALIVVGGDTLSAVLAASHASWLECHGEVAPGLPLAVVRGGRMEGRTIITKSGGFGDAGLLARLVQGWGPPADA